MARSSITRGLALWKVVEKAFGLEGRRISRLVLDLRAGQAPRIRISEYMTTDAEQEIIRVFEQSDWHEPEARIGEESTCSHLECEGWARCRVS